MDPIILKAYNGLTGTYLGRLPYTTLSGQDSISDEGSMNAAIPDCKQLRLIPDLDPYLHDWGTIYAAHMGARILHAGYLTSHSLNDTRDELTLTIGGGFTILNKRKVLNVKLRDSWKDGYVLIDEDHPPGGVGPERERLLQRPDPQPPHGNHEMGAAAVRPARHRRRRHA
ncbi:MAG: hypothetical protein ACLTGO_11045 [Bifidobacterium scardovii]